MLNARASLQVSAPRNRPIKHTEGALIRRQTIAQPSASLPLIYLNDPSPPGPDAAFRKITQS